MKNITFKRNDISYETRMLRSVEGRAVKSVTVSQEGISIVCEDHIILHIDQKLEITGNLIKNPDAVRLDDVAEIVMVGVSGEERTVDVIYKDFEGLVNSYRFYEDDITIWSQCRNIRSFKTEVLNDSRHTQLEFSYNDEYFCPMYHVDEDGGRTRYGYYDLDYPCTTFGRKVRFEIDEDCIRVHGIGHFEHFLLMTKEVYGCLSDFDRMSLHRFVKTAEAYINNLYVNRDYDYELVLNGDECDEVQEIIDKLSAVLEEGGFKKKCYFSDGEQGHPAGSEVYIFDDGEMKFVWYWQIEFYGSGDYVTIKCDDEVLEKVMQIAGADIRNKLIPKFDYNKFYSDFPDTQLINWQYIHFPGLPDDMVKADYCHICKSQDMWFYKDESEFSDNTDRTLYCKTCGYYNHWVIKYTAYSDESSGYTHDSYLYDFGIYSDFSVLRKVLKFQNSNGNYRIELWDNGTLVEFTDSNDQSIEWKGLKQISIDWNRDRVCFTFDIDYHLSLHLSFDDAQPILDHMGIINKKLPDLHTLKERYFTTS